MEYYLYKIGIDTNLRGLCRASGQSQDSKKYPAASLELSGIIYPGLHRPLVVLDNTLTGTGGHKQKLVQHANHAVA